MVVFRIGGFSCLLFLAGQVSAQAPIRHDLSEFPSGVTEAVAFRPDGKLLASYGDVGKLRLWETSTGELLAKSDYRFGLSGYVKHRGMAFSPDGKTLAVGVWRGVGTTGHIFLWDVGDGRTMKLRAVVKEHAGWGVAALAFTPDGDSLFSAHGERGQRWEVRLQDTASWERRAVFPGRDMALSADGRLLVTGTPNEVKVWNWRANQQTASWKVESLNRLALSPDGKILAISSLKRGITFWDVATGTQCTDLRSMLAASSPMAFRSDGRRFVAFHRDRRAVPTASTMTITDLATGHSLAKYAHRGVGHILTVAWSPDGKLLASGNYDESAHAELHLRDVSGLPAVAIRR